MTIDAFLAALEKTVPVHGPWRISGCRIRRGTGDETCCPINAVAGVAQPEAAELQAADMNMCDMDALAIIDAADRTFMTPYRYALRARILAAVGLGAEPCA